MIRLVSILLALCFVAASAGEPLPPVVYLPHEKGGDIAPGGKQIFMPYERFLALAQAAQKKEEELPRPSVGAVLHSWQAKGKIEKECAILDIKGQVDGLEPKGWATVKLPGAVALTEVSSSNLTFERTAEALAIHVPKAGRYEFSAKTVALVELDANGRRGVRIPLPGAGACSLSLSLNVADAAITVEPRNIPTALVREGDTTTIHILASGEREVVVRWQGQVIQAVEGDPTLLVETQALITVEESFLRLQQQFAVAIQRAPLRRAVFELPKGWKALSVQAPDLDHWKPVGDTVELAFKNAPKESVNIALVCEQRIDPILEGTPRALELGTVQLIGAARHVGIVAVDAGEGMQVQAQQSDLPRLDAAQTQFKQADLAWRAFDAKPKIAIQAIRLSPEIRVQAQQTVFLGRQDDRISLQLDVEVRRAGIFQLILSVPALWKPEPEALGDLDLTALGEPKDGRQRWGLTLKKRLSGRQSFPLRFTAPASLPKEAGVQVAVDPVLVEGAKLVQGVLAIVAPRSYALSSRSANELTAFRSSDVVVPNLETDHEVALAWRWRTAPESKTPSAQVDVSIRSREVRLSAEHSLIISEDQARGISRWTGKVEHSPLAELRVQIPSNLDERLVWKATELSGSPVKQSSKDGITTWLITFGSPIIGDLRLSLEWSLPHAVRPNAQIPVESSYNLPRVLDATRITETLALAREGSMSIEKSSSSLDSLPLSSVPAGLMQAGLVAAYAGPGPAITTISLVKHDFLSMSDLAITQAIWSTVCGADGTVQVEAHLTLANRGRSQVDLRVGGRVLEIRVDGETPKISRRTENGAEILSIPLGSGASGQARPQRLSLLYTAPDAFQGGSASAKISIPFATLSTDASHPLVIQSQYLIAWIPAKYLLSGVKGSLTQSGRPVSIWEHWMGLDGETSTDGVDLPADHGGLSSVGTALGEPIYLSGQGASTQVELKLLSRSVLGWLTLLAAALGLALAVIFARKLRQWGLGILIAAVILIGAAPLWQPMALGLLLSIAFGGLSVHALDTFRAWKRNRKIKEQERQEHLKIKAQNKKEEASPEVPVSEPGEKQQQ